MRRGKEINNTNVIMDNLQLIQSKIYEIRGQKVMLDFDLAEMYCVETKRLKEAVRRNIDRFEGDDFMFELTKKEITELSRTQFATLNKGRGSNIKYLPFAFTKLGVAMLSSVLNSKPAIEINRGIMRAFVAVRQMLSNPIESRIERIETQVKELKQYMEEVLVDQNDINDDTMIQLELINQTLAELQTKDRGFKERKRIGYKLPGCEEDDKTKY
jgi:ORF6N domain